MEHVYAALLLNQTNEELNEENLTAVLEAAGCEVVESRTKALVAALEGVDVDRIDDASVDGIGAPEDGDTAGETGPEIAASVEGEEEEEEDAGDASDAGAAFTETPFTEADADLPGGDGDPSDDEHATVE